MAQDEIFDRVEFAQPRDTACQPHRTMQTQFVFFRSLFSCPIRVDLLSVLLCVWQFDDNKRRKRVDTSCVKQSDSPSTLYTYCGEPDQRNTDTSTNYYDTSKYVIDVLGGAVSKTYRRLPESRNHRHVITTLSRAQVVITEAARISLLRGSITSGR